MPNTIGVDIASYQGLPDWVTAYKAGYRFAYVKTTQGLHYLNPEARDQRRGAFQASFKVGNYHFATALTGNPKGQAEWFLHCSNIEPWHLVPFLDLEELGSAGVSPKELENFAYVWGVTVTKALGIKQAMLYTDLNMLHNRILVTTRLRRLFLLDLADWTLGPVAKAKGWDTVLQQFDPFHNVPGFRGAVDRNRCFVPLDTLTIANMRQADPPRRIPPQSPTFLQRLRGRIT
jgi:GH25 family lysozyme M1 (1,4-beta-N-acetylmuramidase)